jgi:hypothetical protein
LNPILGETFECKSGDTHFLSEQVSHHPPISAFHFEHEPTGIEYYGHTQVIAKFGGNSVAADFAGDAFLSIPKYGEVYQFSYPMPTMHARGLMIGKSRNELGGEMWMECEKSGLKTNFTFKTTVCVGSPHCMRAHSHVQKRSLDTIVSIGALSRYRAYSVVPNMRLLERLSLKARRRNTLPRGPACGMIKSS